MPVRLSSEQTVHIQHESSSTEMVLVKVKSKVSVVQKSLRSNRHSQDLDSVMPPSSCT